MKRATITKNKYHFTKENLRAWEQEWKKDRSRPPEKDWLEIFPQARSIAKQKIRKLEKQTETLSSEIYKDLVRIYKQERDEFSVWFWETVVEIFKGEELEEIEKRIRRLRWALSPINENKKDKITEEMLQRAREYPFENLIEFNRAKKVLCMFHGEKHPSLSLNPKTNRIKCFGCGINYDTIEYIMKTQGLSFIEAVKFLNR